MVLSCCSVDLVRQSCWLKSFLITLILMAQLFPFSAFRSRTNPKKRNIPVTPKMVSKVTIDLDYSKVSNPDCIPVMVLKNFESDFSYTCWSIQYVFQRVLFFRLLKGLICSLINSLVIRALIQGSWTQN